MSVDDRLREELGALLDGELPPDREAELRARIEREPELARELDALRRTVTAVRGLGHESAPAALRERIARSLAAPAARPRRARVVRPRWWLATAAVLLVAVGAALLAQLGDEPRRPPLEYEAARSDREAPPPAEDLRDVQEGVATLEERLARREADDVRSGGTGPGGAKGGGRAPVAPAEEQAEAEALGLGDEAGTPEPEADTAPAERPAGKAQTVRRRDATDKKEDATRRRGVLSVLARDGRLAPDIRREYLAAVAALEPARIADHVAGLPEIRVQAPAPTSPSKGPAPANEVKKAKASDGERTFGAAAATPPPLQVVMADRAEAETLARLLRAGYPGPKAVEPRGASKTVEIRRDSGVDLVLQLTTREKEQVRNWLALIDVTRPPGKPAAIVQRPRAPGEVAGGADGEKAERESVRIRIGYRD